VAGGRGGQGGGGLPMTGGGGSQGGGAPVIGGLRGVSAAAGGGVSAGGGVPVVTLAFFILQQSTNWTLSPWSKNEAVNGLICCYLSFFMQ